MRRVSLIAISVVFAALVSGCGKSGEKTALEADASKPHAGGTLIYGKNGPPITLDPALTQETESSVIVVSIFDGLVEQRAGRAVIDPALAKSWDISSNGLVYTFHLRTGVTFHDGTPFNADAVLFTFDRQHNPKSAYTKKHNFEFWKSFAMDEVMKGIRAVDDSTVEITLRNPDATFLNVLTLNFMGIVSPAAAAKYGDDFERHPVGAGPFVFAGWDSSSGTVITVANDHFWNGRPYLDTLIFKPVPDAKLRWQMLKDGQLDMMSTPDQADIQEIENSPDIKYSKQPGLNLCYVAMNMEKKPFNDLKVRQAVVYAINRDQLVQQVYGSLGRPAKNPIPPNLLGYNEEIHFTPYDPAKSRQLLAEAGYPKGFKTDLWILPIVRDYMPNGKLAGELVQKDLKAVGIDATIVETSWNDFLTRRNNGDHEMCFSGWVGDAPDPHFFFYPLLDKVTALHKPSTNNSFYKSEKMHELISRGKTTADPIERSAIYKQACVIFNEDLPWFTIAHAVSIVPMRDYVMDFQLHSSAVRRFEKVWLNK